MAHQVLRTADAPSSPLYNQGIRAGELIYVSGMVGLDPVTGQLAGPDIASQTRRALANCEAVLAAGGGGRANIIEVGVLLADPDDFDGFNAEWATWFPVDPPARYVARLGVDLPGVLVSIRLTGAL